PTRQPSSALAAADVCGSGAGGSASEVVAGVAAVNSAGPCATADILSSKLNVTPADTAKNTLRYEFIASPCIGRFLSLHSAVFHIGRNVFSISLFTGEPED